MKPQTCNTEKRRGVLCLLFTSPLLIGPGYSQWQDRSRSFLTHKVTLDGIWPSLVSFHQRFRKFSSASSEPGEGAAAQLYMSTESRLYRGRFDELCCCVGPFKDETQVFAHISSYICIGTNPVWLLRPSAEFQKDTFQLDWWVMHRLFSRCCLLDTLS